MKILFGHHTALVTAVTKYERGGSDTNLLVVAAGNTQKAG